MTYSKTLPEHLINIEAREESVIINYFATINQEEFRKTASLFTEQGELLAPFEKPIVGREAIANYLAKEAKGMKLLPQQGIYQSTEDNIARIEITGKVKTSLFSVNVAWYFNLNIDKQINTAKIKLLASPKELLSLQQKRDS